MSTGRAAWLGWATLLGGAALVLAESCTGLRTYGSAADAPVVAAADAGLAVLELWVDAHSAPAGDGTPARPFRRLEDALVAPAPRRLVHLAPGLYPGPFVAPDGTELVGGSAAVLTADGPVTVVEANGRVTLRRLLVQGGRLGIRAKGELLLAEVRLSGQRTGAISIAEGGGLEAERVVLEASVSEGVGLLLEPGARAHLSGCTFDGPWRRGIEASAPGRLQLQQSRFVSAVTALHLRDGVAELSDVTASGGRGPGLYVVGGTLRLLRVAVTGHEYGLLTGTGATVEAEDFTSTRAERAGVGVVNARARFTHLVIGGAGNLGGLQGVDSAVTVTGLRIEDVTGHGVSVRGGTLRLEDAVVRRTRDADGAGGDGLQLRNVHATVSGLRVEQTAGPCLMAAEASEVTVSRATLEQCHGAGLLVDSAARLTVESVSVRTSDGPGAMATGDGQLVLRGFSTTAVGGPVWADCATGARVTTWDVAGLLPTLPCIERRGTSPR